jgi:aquaporin Z
MILVLIGVGSLISVVNTGGASTLVGVGLAFGIAVIAMVYTIGPISGCHINPAVTIGVLAIGGIKVKDALMYIIFQVIGAIIAGAVLWMLFTDMGASTAGWAAIFNGASNHYATTGNGVVTIFILELLIAMVLQVTILGSLGNKAWNVNAGLAIGFVVAALIYLAGPIDGAGLNPLRAIGPAIFANGNAMEQLWLFIVAPIVGAVVGSFLFKWLGKADAA